MRCYQFPFRPLFSAHPVPRVVVVVVVVAAAAAAAAAATVVVSVGTRPANCASRDWSADESCERDSSRLIGARHGAQPLQDAGQWQERSGRQQQQQHPPAPPPAQPVAIQVPIDDFFLIFSFGIYRSITGIHSD